MNTIDQLTEQIANQQPIAEIEHSLKALEPEKVDTKTLTQWIDGLCKHPHSEAKTFSMLAQSAAPSGTYEHAWIQALMHLKAEDYDEGLYFLDVAAQLEPEEMFPYIHAAEVYYHLNRDTDALTKVDQGLAMDPNHERLWLVLKDIYVQMFNQEAGNYLKQKSQVFHSWYGRILAERLAPNPQAQELIADLQTLALELENDPVFWIEWTAILGQFEQHHLLIQEVGRYRMRQQDIPWQVLFHHAQALIALDRDQEAEKELKKLKLTPGLDPESLSQIESLLQEMQQKPIDNKKESKDEKNH